MGTDTAKHAKDKTKRLSFARKMKKIVDQNPDFLKKEVSFYLDAVSFIHKSNPMKEAMKLAARNWQKRNEGISDTAKGSKDLAEGKRVHVVIVVSHKTGVVAVKKYGKMNGNYFTNRNL